MQQIISKLPRQTCREIKSSMTLEEEQLCDWTHMASAFFRGLGKGRMHTSEYFQPTEFFQVRIFLQREEIRSIWVGIISNFLL